MNWDNTQYIVQSFNFRKICNFYGLSQNYERLSKGGCPKGIVATLAQHEANHWLIFMYPNSNQVTNQLK